MSNALCIVEDDGAPVWQEREAIQTKHKPKIILPPTSLPDPLSRQDIARRAVEAMETKDKAEAEAELNKKVSGRKRKADGAGQPKKAQQNVTYREITRKRPQISHRALSSPSGLALTSTEVINESTLSQMASTMRHNSTSSNNFFYQAQLLQFNMQQRQSLSKCQMDIIIGQRTALEIDSEEEEYEFQDDWEDAGTDGGWEDVTETMYPGTEGL
ncbi:hypothetical protein BT69DRAFT_1306799 [Atractiella rhizophila]|nr:hypothetical protein BT69DRAFT_1306799 [Atractiella rhizophila]